MPTPSVPTHTPWWHHFVPQIVSAMRDDYGLRDLRDDVLAGLTVAIVAIPLSMALAIASGLTPDKGLITVVVAGFLISLLGGSRYQIGGPAGAFVVIIYMIIQTHGYDGLVIATLMAGVILMLAALARLGEWIRYIPQPVITGFTAGIAVIIFSSQIGDIFGLTLDKVPGDFIGKWSAFWAARDSLNLSAFYVSAGTLAVIILLRRFAPRAPAFLLAVVLSSLAVYALKVPVATIGSVFGEMPHSIPAPHFPDITLARFYELLPTAFLIAFLAGLESLLCAVVADGMTGRRHRSNAELMAQGIGNFGSALFGGMPATGTIARTATNIRAGGKSPLSGIFHAGLVLLCMMVFAPMASFIPLAGLGAILVIVAWNMSELHQFRMLLRGPRGDALVLIVTFLLTVIVDLAVAIEVGVVLGAMLFMHRMSQTVKLQTGLTLFEDETDDLAAPAAASQDNMQSLLPAGVEAFQIQGPLFFGVSARLIDALNLSTPPPAVFIVRMSQVPMMDSSGALALAEFVKRCRKAGTKVILSGLRPSLIKPLREMNLVADGADIFYTDRFGHALDRARDLIAAKE